MKQSLRHTRISDLQRKLSELVEKIVGGFSIGDRDFPGLTVKARRSMLVLLEQVVFFTIGRTNPDRGNIYNVLRRMTKKILSGSLWQSQYSPKYCAEMASQQFDDVGFSESHMHKIREYCAALGVFTIEHREFDRGGDGKFLPGQNKGKKYASWLFDIDFEQLALVACAVIQSLKSEATDSSHEFDAWTRLKPKKGCALIALLWRQVGLKGSIFCPELEDNGTPFEEHTYAEYVKTEALAQKMSAVIYEDQARAKQCEEEGRSMSPAFWQVVRQNQEALRKLEERMETLKLQLPEKFIDDARNIDYSAFQPRSEVSPLPQDIIDFANEIIAEFAQSINFAFPY